MRTVYGKVLTPYPLNSGETYKWDFRTGTIVAVIVRYTRASEPLRWLVAASGIWMSDGYHFRSGKALKDRSELFI